MIEYALCTIRFKDSDATEEVIIKLSLDHTEREDSRVFFYCDGYEELKKLMESDNGEDFVVLDYQPTILIY